MFRFLARNSNTLDVRSVPEQPQHLRVKRLPEKVSGKQPRVLPAALRSEQSFSPVRGAVGEEFLSRLPPHSVSQD